jgi:hypothetical protein
VKKNQEQWAFKKEKNEIRFPKTKMNTPKQNERLENPKCNKIGKGGRGTKTLPFI